MRGVKQHRPSDPKEQVTIKSSLALRDWLLKEQLRINMEERLKPSQADVLDRMRTAYEETLSKKNLLHSASQTVTFSGKSATIHSEEELRIIKRVLRLWRSRDMATRKAFLSTLKFSELHLYGRPSPGDANEPSGSADEPEDTYSIGVARAS